MAKEEMNLYKRCKKIFKSKGVAFDDSDDYKTIVWAHSMGRDMTVNIVPISGTVLQMPDDHELYSEWKEFWRLFGNFGIKNYDWVNKGQAMYGLLNSGYFVKGSKYQGSFAVHIESSSAPEVVYIVQFTYGEDVSNYGVKISSTDGQTISALYNPSTKTFKEGNPMTHRGYIQERYIPATKRSYVPIAGANGKSYIIGVNENGEITVELDPIYSA